MRRSEKRSENRGDVNRERHLRMKFAESVSLKEDDSVSEFLFGVDVIEPLNQILANIQQIFILNKSQTTPLPLISQK
jgi:hypothetical protein